MSNQHSDPSDSAASAFCSSLLLCQGSVNIPIPAVRLNQLPGDSAQDPRAGETDPTATLQPGICVSA